MAARSAQVPDGAASAWVHRGDRGGAAMEERACTIVCRPCGMARSCSDLAC